MLVLLFDLILLFQDLVQLIADRLVALLLLPEFVAQIGHDLAERHFRELRLLVPRQTQLFSFPIVDKLGSLTQLTHQLPHHTGKHPQIGH